MSEVDFALSISDVLSLAFGGILAGFTIIEFSPLKINPWSFLGKIINADICAKVEAVNEKVDSVREDVKSVQEKVDESEAKAARTRILRFADELYQGQLHSKEHFDTMLLDITAYDNYCAEHPGFKNEKTRMAEEQIRESYEECCRERKFLR